MVMCKTCGVTNETADFYPSIGTYCKDHWKERVRQNRADRADHYRAYEQSRASLPHRVAARTAYSFTTEGRQKAAEAKQRYAAKKRGGRPPRSERQAMNPAIASARKRARMIAGNAVRDGKLAPWPACAHPEGCECTNVEAHHPDYSRPLDVVWLCPAHHKQAHALARQVLP